MNDKRFKTCETASLLSKRINKAVIVLKATCSIGIDMPAEYDVNNIQDLCSRNRTSKDISTDGNSLRERDTEKERY